MIFEKAKAILIHIPKTGGTTITHSLSHLTYKSHNPKLGVTPLTYHRKITAAKNNNARNRVHVSAKGHLEYLGDKYYEYYSFAFVRDPFSQIRSLFKQLQTMNRKVNPRFIGYREMSFEDFVMKDEKKSLYGENRVLTMQKDMVTKGNKIIVNDVFPFDYFVKACRIIEKKIGHPITTRYIYRHTKTEEKYTPEMIHRVLDICKDSYEFHKKVKKDFESKFL